MRVSLFALLSLAAVPFTSAAAPAAKADTKLVSEGVDTKAKNSLTDDIPETTKFNGLDVPAIRNLGSQDFEETIKHGNWLVEFFSPYCGHCMHFAPVLQTAYEFYYTSNPIPGQKPKGEKGEDTLNSFSRYYDFKFAKVDCVAFGNVCSEQDANAFPTIMLYKDGKKVKNTTGALSMNELSKWIEEALESIRPGSRPKEGIALPQVGARSMKAEDAKPSKPEAKDKDPAAGSAAASIHKDIVTKTAEASVQATKLTEKTSNDRIDKKPVKVDMNVNPNGISVDLDPEKFQRLVTNTMDPWFVKFYAPWCPHCQTMAPNWAQMAREMKHKLNIGEVNCDKEKRLCRDAGVRGYPSLLFFRGGERIEYDGLRGVGDLISFSNKAVITGAGVEDVDYDTFVELEETEEVIFVYCYDHGTVSEDFMALERLTLSLVGHARLVKTQDPRMFQRFKVSTWPRLLVSRDGKPSYYPPLSPKDMRDVRKILDWMKSVWLPIVPELSTSNAHEIMDNRIVVLGILSRERSDEFVLGKREIKNAALEWIDKQTHMWQLERQELRDAKQLRIEEADDRGDSRGLRAAKQIKINMDEIPRKEVGFAWVDGVFWERWIRTTFGIDVKDGERVIINDEDNHNYWDITINGDPIRASRTSILETLRSVTASPPKIQPKSTGNAVAHFFFRLKNTFFGHPWITLVGSVVILTVGFVARRKGPAMGWRRRGGSIILGEKDGLLGGMQGGKVD